MFLRLASLLGVLALFAPTAAAQTDPPREVRLVFDGSAAGLQQDQIRASVDRELGRPSVSAFQPGVPELRIAVSPEGDLVLVYAAPDRPPEQRMLRAPARAEDVAELIGLAAATLVRNGSQSSPSSDPLMNVHPPLVPLRPQPEVPRQPPRATPPGDPMRNFIGVAAGLDFVRVSTTDGVCVEPYRSKFNQLTFSCYYAGGFPAVTNGATQRGAVSGGLLTGTSRLLLSYDRAFEHFRAGVRLGLSFDSIPVSYVPVHAEVRIAHLLGEPGRGTLRFGVFVGSGFARMTGKTRVDALISNTPVALDGYATVGWWFVSFAPGLVYQPFESLELEAALPFVWFAPSALGFTPQIAGRVGF